MVHEPGKAPQASRKTAAASSRGAAPRRKREGSTLPRAGGWLASSVLLTLLPDLASGVGESPRLAYVDPGAGSFVLQAVVAMFAGAIVAINAYWAKIKRFLGRARQDPDSNENLDPSDDR